MNRKIKIIIHEQPSNLKTAAEKYIMTLYDKTVSEFLRDMEQTEMAMMPDELDSS